MNLHKMKNERKRRIEKEVEKTLQQLDRFEKLESDPFFYIRLQAKLKSLQGRPILSVTESSVGRYLRFAFLILLFFLNLVSAVVVFHNHNSQSDSQITNISSFADEYSLNDKSYDDYFTNK